MKTRIMYVESKGGGSHTDRYAAWIGRVTYSKTGSSLCYRGKRLIRAKGKATCGNYIDEDSGEEYWVSGPKANGQDRLFGKSPVHIDEDVREEYWTKIRKQPSMKERAATGHGSKA